MNTRNTNKGLAAGDYHLPVRSTVRTFESFVTFPTLRQRKNFSRLSVPASRELRLIWSNFLKVVDSSGSWEHLQLRGSADPIDCRSVFFRPKQPNRGHKPA